MHNVSGNFSSALRLFVLEYYRDKAEENLHNELLGEQSMPPPPVIS
jgi:predicted DNA-binding ribbon-helix-helix protein